MVTGWETISRLSILWNDDIAVQSMVGLTEVGENGIIVFKQSCAL
jgi:hypothetical protein